MNEIVAMNPTQSWSPSNLLSFKPWSRCVVLRVRGETEVHRVQPERKKERTKEKKRRALRLLE